MVLDVDAVSAAAAPPEGIVIEAAHGALLDRIADLQERVWDISLPWLPRVLREMSEPGTGTAEVFCARAGDRIVGSGWIEFHGGSPFAQLCGGAVLADWRGRGIYSALYACRIAQAKARGVPWIAVDAAPMSRPILEEKGFRFVCHTYPMRTRPYASAVTRG